MSNLLSELDAVVGLSDKATPGEWYADPCIKQGSMVWSKTETAAVVGAEDEECRYGAIEDENAVFVSALVNLFRTHHAEIAAAVRDSQRYRWLRDHQFSFTHDQHERGIASMRWGEWIDVDDAETLDLCIDTVMRDGSDHDRKVAAMIAREGE